MLAKLLEQLGLFRCAVQNIQRKISFPRREPDLHPIDFTAGSRRRVDPVTKTDDRRSPHLRFVACDTAHHADDLACVGALLLIRKPIEKTFDARVSFLSLYLRLRHY